MFKFLCQILTICILWKTGRNGKFDLLIFLDLLQNTGISNGKLRLEPWGKPWGTLILEFTMGRTWKKKNVIDLIFWSWASEMIASEADLMYRHFITTATSCGLISLQEFHNSPDMKVFFAVYRFELFSFALWYYLQVGRWSFCLVLTFAHHTVACTWSCSTWFPCLLRVDFLFRQGNNWQCQCSMPRLQQRKFSNLKNLSICTRRKKAAIAAPWVHCSLTLMLWKQTNYCKKKRTFFLQGQDLQCIENTKTSWKIISGSACMLVRV